MKLSKCIAVSSGLLSFATAQGSNNNGDASNVHNYTLTDPTPFCKMDKDEKIGPNCDTTITQINEINRNIRNDLLGLVKTDFFKYFKFDPFKKCTIWENNEGLCFSRSCAIDVVEDWDSLPEYWQPEVLGGLKNDTIDNDSSIQDHKDTKFLDQLCDLNNNNNNNNDKLASTHDEEDDGVNYYDINDFTSEDAALVDLSQNPERFTGYGGQEAGQIWKSIYAENCFSTNDKTEQCLAKDGFYRIVSGLHASIGTHLSNDHLNTETGNWEPDLDLFMARVGNFPERVSNIYFNYALIAKSLWKIKPYLKELDFCNDYDNDVKSKIINIVSQLDNKIFDEDLMFKGEVGSTLQDDFRRRFKNVTKIMDCVHCDRCKLWGKVQTTGYATSLKILFELDEADEQSKQRVVNKLTKYELIALINTFDRLSNSIQSINNFEIMYNDRLKSNSVTSFFHNNFFKILSKAKNTIYEKINGSSSTENDSLSNDNIRKLQQASDIVKEKTSPKFVDLKMPNKNKLNLKENSRNYNDSMTTRIKQAWNVEIHNYMEALRFIWRSYLDFPRNLWRLSLSYITKSWNKFIGFAGYIDEEQNPIVYSLDIQS